MMRLLIEKFRVDINELRSNSESVRILHGLLYNRLVPTDSALYYAARGYS
jgi:hypothetical protein